MGLPSPHANFRQHAFVYNISRACEFSFYDLHVPFVVQVLLVFIYEKIAVSSSTLIGPQASKAPNYFFEYFAYIFGWQVNGILIPENGANATH
jgi:hypothetical protein